MRQNINKDIIAIIPARGGSKGLPGKNIRSFLGKPLIAHAIEAALKSDVFKGVYVTSDAQDILDVAFEYGAIPMKRGEELSADDVPMSDVLVGLHDQLQVSGYACGDGFALLQPTSPLRTFRDLRECVQLYHEDGVRSVVSVCKQEHCPQKSLVIREGAAEPLFDREMLNANRQSLEESYRQNGVVWITDWHLFLKHKYFLTAPTKPYVMPSELSVDIDTLADFVTAEDIARREWDCA